MNPEATDHRSECAEILINTAIELAGGRSGVAIDLAVLKDMTGLNKVDFAEALGAHISGDHLSPMLWGDRYSMEINGREVDTLIVQMDLLG